jgi:hypothetical protein
MTKLLHIFANSTHCSVWISKPKTGIHERVGNQGRHPIRERVLEGETSPIEVQKIKDMIDPSQWKQVLARKAETHQCLNGKNRYV